MITDRFDNASLCCASGRTPVYGFTRKGRRIAFYKTLVGAPITEGLAEDAAGEPACGKLILFGGAGCLNKEIARGRIMVPTAAFRDEGSACHCAPEWGRRPASRTVPGIPKLPGYVLCYTSQCPFNARYVPILERTAKERGIPFRAIHLKTKDEARRAPAPITSYALFYDGEYLTNEQMNDTKFLKLASR